MPALNERSRSPEKLRAQPCVAESGEEAGAERHFLTVALGHLAHSTLIPPRVTPREVPGIDSAGESSRGSIDTAVASTDGQFEENAS